MPLFSLLKLRQNGQVHFFRARKFNFESPRGNCVTSMHALCDGAVYTDCETTTHTCLSLADAIEISAQYEDVCRGCNTAES
jgi:hypothetical protein